MITYIKYRLVEFLYGGAKINIPKGALVLDVASGGKPYWRSNVLFDKFIMDDSERDGGVVIDRDFVVGDVYQLPFKDKAFDFVVARHILEHLDKPEVFLAELQRVAKAGYIETPSSLSEKVFGWPFHIWMIDVENKQLNIRPKTEEADWKKFGQQFFKDKNLANFLWSRRDIFYTSYYWQDKIDYVFDSSLAQPTKDIVSTDYNLDKFDLNSYLAKRSLKAKVKSRVDQCRRKLAGADTKVAFSELLRCVKCGTSSLVKQGEELICDKCQHKFELKNNIPVIL